MVKIVIAINTNNLEGQSIPATIYKFSDPLGLGMLCPSLTMQGESIGESGEG